MRKLLAARCLWGADSLDKTSTGMEDVTTSSIARMTDERQSPLVRVQAGQTLAHLGDSRPGVGVDPETDLPDIVWCEAPAGPFLMGSTDADEMTYSSEKPQHEMTLPAFKIAKYPVTNVQYAAFVKAGGYREPRYWTEAGWRLQEWLESTGARDYGEPFNLSNHPVVGVNWYAAMAFCHWLTEQLHQSGQLQADKEITLPTEPQWEKAARGADGCIYPWGNDPDPNQANYSSTGIGTTSAVGCFPGGISSYRVQDLSGNVWEWCRTRWEMNYKYYSNDNDLAEPFGGSNDRVLRGGSFNLNEDQIRAAYRSMDRANAQDARYGFRVVMTCFSLSSGD